MSCKGPGRAGTRGGCRRGVCHVPGRVLRKGPRAEYFLSCSNEWRRKWCRQGKNYSGFHNVSSTHRRRRADAGVLCSSPEPSPCRRHVRTEHTAPRPRPCTGPRALLPGVIKGNRTAPGALDWSGRRDALPLDVRRRAIARVLVHAHAWMHVGARPALCPVNGDPSPCGAAMCREPGGSRLDCRERKGPAWRWGPEKTGRGPPGPGSPGTPQDTNTNADNHTTPLTPTHLVLRIHRITGRHTQDAYLTTAAEETALPGRMT